MNIERIRNFCIIAHIDHGKSTLADRLLEITGTITQREMENQVLDDMELERERGITIKSKAIRMNYKADDGNDYILNLIDTPGHVDFSYEVSRSLAACEGALLIVDATQGVEAQTISNLYLAIEANLQVIPVINKMDLPSADPDAVKTQIMDLIGCNEDEIIAVSAKTGLNCRDVLEAIVKHIPAPVGDPNAPLQALMFDCEFDSYRGAVGFIRIVQGTIRQNDKIKYMQTGNFYEANEIGIMKKKKEKVAMLSPGEVGYIVTGVKNVRETKVGDTITHIKPAASKPLPGYQVVKPMVYSGIYPINPEDFEDLRESLDKLALNDSSLVYEPESSQALGSGFRCGFLGLLHMEIVQERLDREFDMNIINTVPTVVLKIHMNDGKIKEIANPVDLPDLSKVNYIEEPYVRASIITTKEFIGAIMTLSQEKRGIYQTTNYIDSNRAELIYEIPLSEIIFDYFDKMKSVSKGYASLDYEISNYKEGDLVKMDMKIGGENVDALSCMIHRDRAYNFGKNICKKLKDLIPRQMFEVAIQAAIGARIIARETVKAMRKDVLSKCYGGDISRKRKLLEKQKAGKKRMKQIGSVEVPQEAFLAVLKVDDN
ncbi:MAG: translation elongation factor 4 [Calditrichaeota bacterium]|nr:translation elongation factor 4 [Calditrichota bacterium]